MEKVNGENVRDETNIILYKKRCHIVFMPSWLLIFAGCVEWVEHYI